MPRRAMANGAHMAYQSWHTNPPRVKLLCQKESFTRGGFRDWLVYLACLRYLVWSLTAHTAPLLRPAAEEKRCVGDETLNKYKIHTN